MTSKVRNLVKAPLRERVSAQEWDARVNLAACYRLAAHFRMTDLVLTRYKPKRPEWKALLRMLGKSDASYKD